MANKINVLTGKSFNKDYNPDFNAPLMKWGGDYYASGYSPADKANGTGAYARSDGNTRDLVTLVSDLFTGRDSSDTGGDTGGDTGYSYGDPDAGWEYGGEDGISGSSGATPEVSITGSRYQPTFDSVAARAGAALYDALGGRWLAGEDFSKDLVAAHPGRLVKTTTKSNAADKVSKGMDLLKHKGVLGVLGRISDLLNPDGTLKPGVTFDDLNGWIYGGEDGLSGSGGATGVPGPEFPGTNPNDLEEVVVSSNRTGGTNPYPPGFDDHDGWDYGGEDGLGGSSGGTREPKDDLEEVVVSSNRTGGTNPYPYPYNPVYPYDTNGTTIRLPPPGDNTGNGDGWFNHYDPVVLPQPGASSGNEDGAGNTNTTTRTNAGGPWIDWEKVKADADTAGLGLSEYTALNWDKIRSPEVEAAHPRPAKARGGLIHSYARGGVLNTMAAGRVRGPGSGREDSIDARLSDGEYVVDAETVALMGDGSTNEGARRLDAMREAIRKHKSKQMVKGRMSANAKSPLAYLKGVE